MNKQIETFTLQEFFSENKIKINKWFVEQEYKNSDRKPAKVLSEEAIRYLANQGIHKIASCGSTVKNRLPMVAWEILVAMSKDNGEETNERCMKGIEKILNDLEIIEKTSREIRETLKECLKASELKNEFP